MNAQRAILMNQVVGAWNQAGRVLGIRVEAPFALSAGEKTAKCIAFLPHFGGPQGMVIGTALSPTFDTDAVLIECAQASGLFYSFINPERYADFDEDSFKDTLNDWGFFGARSECPPWFSQVGRK